MPDDVLIADFTCARPASAWTDADSDLFRPIADVPPQTWRIIDYKSRLYVDPMKVAIDKAHSQGQEFWMYIRPQAWVSTPTGDHAFRSRVFAAHPEWRCMEPDGITLEYLGTGLAF
jgi:hypothetical protein